MILHLFHFIVGLHHRKSNKTTSGGHKKTVKYALNCNRIG